ncbi:DUF4294 domain-containing protein [Bacteroidales bacterium OttesenSCG-928-C19]|nr:DUF4294 domain-containing protein [Bacteroidales bacterium OttesenSCG-928-C19]
MKQTLTILVFLTGFSAGIFAQSASPIIARAVIIDGDTIPYFNLSEIQVVSSYSLLTNDEIRKNAKLIRNVKKTLPYAKQAREKLYEINQELAKMPEAKRSSLIKQKEKEIEKEFSAELKKLTFSQGLVLIKLIDRETGSSSFDLVKDLRGSFRAFFYQTFAKIFGYNLKTKFDPAKNKDDELIERICRSIELNRI